MENKFRYSYSRNGLMDSCLRKYFFRYYFHWNGWSYDGNIHEFLKKVDHSDQASKKRWAYIAGKTQNVYSYVGNEIHELVENTLFDLKAGKPRITDIMGFLRAKTSEFEARLQGNLDEQFTLSFIDNPKGKVYFQEFINSSSFLYGFPNGPAFNVGFFMKQARDLFKLNAVNYFRSGLYNGLCELVETYPYSGIEEELYYDYEFMDGDTPSKVTLSIKPDLFTINDSGKLSVFDWKTGSFRNIKIDQLEYYGYLFHRMATEGKLPDHLSNFDINSFNLKVYCLKEQKPLLQEFDPATYQKIKIDNNLRKMSLLTESGLESNIISDEEESKFDQTFDKKLFGCKACPFLKICKGIPEKLKYL